MRYVGMSKGRRWGLGLAIGAGMLWSASRFVRGRGGEGAGTQAGADNDAGRGAESRFMHYVPDELCVVVSVDRAGEIADRHRSVYEQVLQLLNESVNRLLNPEGDGQDDMRDNGSFARDLAPRTVRRRFKDETNIVQPLARPGIPPERPEGAVRPWVLLPGEADRATALHFYQIGRDAAGRDRPSREAADTVRELVNYLNHDLRQRALDDAAADVTARIVAATPNWLSGSAQGYETGGGPGPRPQAPADPALKGWFKFTHPDLQGPGDENRQASCLEGDGAGVVVAVLDTSPERDAVKEAYTQRYQRNWLLKEVLDNNKVKFEGDWSFDPAYWDFLWHYLPNWKHLARDWGPGSTKDERKQRYSMADHGLFVAGIVQTIAPLAEIHLIRVLDECGVGDLLRLVYTLRRLPEELLSGDNAGKRLVVNLSLMVDIPNSADLLDLWFPETAKNLDELRERWTDICAILDTVQTSLTDVLTWLEREQRVLVVAAAGNDGHEQRRRPAPRLPARHDSVLGVAAVDTWGVPARFSNRGDMVVFENGVATLGGDAGRSRPEEKAEIEHQNGRTDAIAGIFSAKALPVNGGANTTGWVYWAGTSFATPIVSALAALLLGQPEHRDLPPRRLMHVIRGYASNPGGDLDCSTIGVKQI